MYDTANEMMSRRGFNQTSHGPAQWIRKGGRKKRKHEGLVGRFPRFVFPV
jgi:hypothetical protein